MSSLAAAAKDLLVEQFRFGTTVDSEAILTISGERDLCALERQRVPLHRAEAAILTATGPSALARADRLLFDAGLIRLADSSFEPGVVYLRSSRILDARATGGRTRVVVAMSNLGHNAGYANQLFQYGFLKLYGLRHNAAVETPPWPGETAYGLAPAPITQRWRMVKGDQWSVGDLAFWERRHPPRDVDFWGYFQNVPPCWYPHRAFWRRLFTPLPQWREPIERWLAHNLPSGATLVAVHLRRGDYRRYEAEQPWFRTIPEDWYLRWLERLWPTLDQPVLFVASDEREQVVPAFARYRPLVATDLEAALPAPRELADLEIMARADVLAICNSSFSRMAAMLAPPAQRAFIPSIASASFEPYDPWRWDHFWARFGAPERRRRSVLPRFLRRA